MAYFCKRIIALDQGAQLKEKHFQTLEDAVMEAKDGEKWRAMDNNGH